MDEVTEAEILAACRAGLVLDCSDGGGRRVVDAALLQKCCDELGSRVHRHGLRLEHAAVTGSLDLSGLDLSFPVYFDDCDFDSPLAVEGARLFELKVTGGTRLPGLLANGVRVRRDLDLSGSIITGGLSTSASTSKQSAIWLCESEIGGRLLCVDTIIDGTGHRSLQADRLRVAGNVRLLHEFRAIGEVRLIGARIDGSLDLTGASLESPRTGLALDLGEAVIEGSVFIIDKAGRRPHVRGRIDMGRARVGGQFLIANATLEATSGVPVGSAYSRARTGGTAISAPRLSVGAELTLQGACKVSGGMDLAMSELTSVSIGPECALEAPGHTALDLTNADVLSSVTLGPGATVRGTVRLAGARIHGRLTLAGVALRDPEEDVLAAQGALIEGGVDLAGLHADGGRLRFSSATLGSLYASGAQLTHEQGSTLSLHQTTVKGTVALVDGFRSVGLVDLNRSTIEGRLELGHGTFVCPGPGQYNEQGQAVEAISAVIRGGIYMAAASISGGVDFTNATTTFLVDDPANWPARFIISGFAYDRFDQPRGTSAGPAWDHVARCAWLGRQVTFDAGPYEQAARVFRQHGYSSGAKAILIARQRHARAAISGRLALPRRALDTAFDLTVSYGYRPGRVLWLLALLVGLVAGSLLFPGPLGAMRATVSGVVYTTHGPVHATAAQRPQDTADACGNGAVLCFNPVLYAIDTVVPVVSLDQRSTWHPDARVPYGTVMQWWLDLATILGWLLSSIFVLALAGLARSV